MSKDEIIKGAEKSVAIDLLLMSLDQINQEAQKLISKISTRGWRVHIHDSSVWALHLPNFHLIHDEMKLELWPAMKGNYFCSVLSTEKTLQLIAFETDFFFDPNDAIRSGFVELIRFRDTIIRRVEDYSRFLES